MKGIAVSLYDKFDDLKILIDIVRDNWNDDYFISVCSNHPDAHKKAGSSVERVDHFEKGAQIRYDNTTKGPRGGNNLSFRIYNCLRTACRPAIKNKNVKYVMHVHSDAWPLDESKFVDIVNEMKGKDSSVAFSSISHMFVEEYPPGGFEDNFIVFDAEDAIKEGLFQLAAVDLPPTWVHKIIPMICISKFGWKNMLQYSNGSEREHWDGKPSAELKNDARPMFVNEKWGQLHLAREDFNSKLGKKLQAYYLNKYNLVKGANIGVILEKYLIKEDELFESLNNYMDNLNKKLSPYGLTLGDFGRDVRAVKEFLHEKGFKDKLRTIVIRKVQHDALKEAFRGLYVFMRGLAKIVVNEGESSNKLESGYNKYTNSSINELFMNEICKDDFPDEIAEELERTFK